MTKPQVQPIRIAPSILASDFVRLAEECQAVLDAGADLLHVDVMDGHYVPNLTIGLPVVEALRHHFPDVTLDVHLMIDNPDDFAVAYVKAGADYVSFHPEVSRHPHRTLAAIREAGAKAALAINPGTSLTLTEWLLEELDMILVMSVNPGFGGQSFIPSAVSKIAELAAMLEQKNLRSSVEIEVDGGVSASNADRLASAGANILVAGSAIFKRPPYAEAIRAIREAAMGGA